jgi:tight adherence protein B
VTALLVLLGAFAGCGVVMVLLALVGGPADKATGKRRRRYQPAEMRRFVLAGAVALTVLVITRWPVAALLAGAAVLGLRGLVSSPAGAVIARLEAIATWTEMLRDTLAGAAGLSQALVGTARVAPEPIRQEVQALATRLTSGVAPRDALVGFADALGDQSADVVVASLLMAVEHRAQRLGDLLGALAATTREQVAMRLRVEASRASARTALRTVAGFSVCFLALLSVLARSYLAPFGTADGQVVMALVGALFGAGLWLMARMARPGAVPRLLLEGQAR